MLDKIILIAAIVLVMMQIIGAKTVDAIDIVLDANGNLTCGQEFENSCQRYAD